jgi:hypothetical protein
MIKSSVGFHLLKHQSRTAGELIWRRLSSDRVLWSAATRNAKQEQLVFGPFSTVIMATFLLILNASANHIRDHWSAMTRSPQEAASVFQKA